MQKNYEILNRIMQRIMSIITSALLNMCICILLASVRILILSYVMNIVEHTGFLVRSIELQIHCLVTIMTGAGLNIHTT